MDNQIPQELLIAYKKTIPGKLEGIKKLIDQVKKRPEKEELAALRFALHKLAGNSGVYGYLKVCQLCKDTENTLSNILENFPTIRPDPIWIDQLDRIYAEIKKGFEDGEIHKI